MHPALVPDAVKFTALSLLKNAKGEEPAAEARRVLPPGN